MNQTPIRIFISYARQDELYFKLLKEGIDKHSKRSRKFSWQTWSDQDMLPGQKWHEAIQDQVQRCDCALLFVSANFLNSDYIERHEFEEFVRRQEKEHFRFFPILISPFAIEQWEELHKRQFFSAEGRNYGQPEKKGILSYSELIKFDEKGLPIANPERDRYHMNLVKALEQVIDQLLTERPTKPVPQDSSHSQTGISKGIAPMLKLGVVQFQLKNKVDFFEKAEDGTLPIAMQHFRYKRDALSTRSTAEDLARTFQMGNEIARLVLEDQKQLREKVLDSDHLKRLYVDVQFDAIAFGEELKYNTEILITQKRQQRAKFPWHERSLIVSALTLSLLQSFNADKVYHLIDFVRGKEELVWKRALVGLYLAIILHEKQITSSLIDDLLILKRDIDIQEGLLEIEEALGSEIDYKQWEKHKVETAFEKSYEFFEKPQHWFLPFYPGNPVLHQHVRDQSLLVSLPKSTNWHIDAFKYAFCLNHAKVGFHRNAKLLNRMERATEKTRLWHQWNKHKFPNEDSETAYRKAKEFENYLQEILFFTSNYPGEAFKEISLEKRSLHKTSLSDFLLEDIYLLRIEAVHHLLFTKDYVKAVDLLLQILSEFPEDIVLLHRIAYCYGRLGNFDKAIEYQQKAIDLEPSIANLWINLAYYFEQKKEVKSALRFRLKAEKVDPNIAHNLESIASYYGGIENFDDAIQYQQRAAELEPENAICWGMLGHYFQQNKDFKTALKFRAKAENIDPNMAWNLAKTATCYGELKNFDEAIQYQQRAAELEPDDAIRWGMLGYYYEQNKDFNTALKFREKADSIDPNIAWNLSGIASCHSHLENLDKAIQHQQRAAKLEPENAIRWGTLGYYFQQNKDFNTALKFRKKAENIDPNMAWNLVGITTCYDELEDFNKALQYQQRVASLEPNEANHWGILGYYYEQNKDFNTALKFREKADSIDPNIAWNLSGIASCHSHLKNHDKAIQYQQRAANLEPDDASKWGMLGYYHEQNEDFETALKFRVKAESMDSNMAWNLAGIASCYSELENFNKAIRYQQRATNLEPNNPNHWGMLGYHYEQNKDFKTALKFRVKAENIDPNIDWNLAGIANCYSELENYDKAIEYQQRVAKFDPKKSNKWEILGLYYLHASKTNQALKYFQKALELDFQSLKEKANAPATLASIAWTYFLMGEFDQSKDYFDKEKSYQSKEKWTYHPCMNQGHIALIQGDLSMAKSKYKQAMQIATQNDTTSSLWSGFQEDEFHLIRFGVSKEKYWEFLEEIKGNYGTAM